MLTEKEKEMLDLYRGLDEEEFASLTEEEAKIYEDLENRYLTPEQEANIQALRNAALKEQADYKRYYESMHAPTIPDVLPGKVYTNDNQGYLGKTYDAFSYPLRLALGGWEGLAKTIYDDAESGTRGIARVAKGKDLNYLEKEATNPINVAAAAGGPLASKVVRYGGEGALKYLPALASLLSKGGKWTKTGLAALREGIAQGALVAPGQTLGENLKRWSKGEGEEMLGLAPMMGYGALGGALGEAGAIGLKGLGKKAFSSEVKLVPTLQEKAANPPNVDFLFETPKEYISEKPLLNYIPLVEPLRKFVNVGRKSGYEKDGKFVETTSQLVPLGGVDELLKRVEDFGNDWLAKRAEFASGTDAVVNLKSIFDNTADEIRNSPDLGDEEKIKVLARLQEEWQDALRTYHKVSNTIVDKKSVLDDYPANKAQRNYPIDLSIPSDVMDVATVLDAERNIPISSPKIQEENIPIIKFKDVLKLRTRAGKNAKFDKYKDPKSENIETGLYRALYKNINENITRPSQNFGLSVPSEIKGYKVKNPKAIEDLVNANIDQDYIVNHNLSGKDLEDFLKTQDVLKHTTPWELALPRAIARTLNKNLVGLPEMIGAGSVGLVGGTAGNAMIDEDDSEAQKLGKIFGGAVLGGLGGLGTVKATMRGLGPARVMYEAGKSLSKEAAPSITMQQFEKDKKNQKTKEKKAAKRAQMLTKGGSSEIQVGEATNYWPNVESIR